jgi:MMP 1-O-methyltransferase
VPNREKEAAVFDRPHSCVAQAEATINDDDKTETDDDNAPTDHHHRHHINDGRFCYHVNTNERSRRRADQFTERVWCCLVSERKHHDRARQCHDGSPVTLTPALLDAARSAIGFMPDDEGIALHTAAMTVASTGPLLEIGAYCGKSAIYLGAAAAAASTVLFSIDHHRGSEENQAGWEHHDPTLVDADTGKMDTLPVFRRTVFNAGLEPNVIAMVGSSPVIAAHWNTPLAFCFIDGGHGRAVAHADYDSWAHHVRPGGLLAIHDVFPDPADGGTPPYEIYLRALGSGWFDLATDLCAGSLRILRRR